MLPNPSLYDVYHVNGAFVTCMLLALTCPIWIHWARSIGSGSRCGLSDTKSVIIIHDLDFLLQRIHDLV